MIRLEGTNEVHLVLLETGAELASKLSQGAYGLVLPNFK